MATFILRVGVILELFFHFNQLRLTNGSASTTANALDHPDASDIKPFAGSRFLPTSVASGTASSAATGNNINNNKRRSMKRPAPSSNNVATATSHDASAPSQQQPQQQLPDANVFLSAAAAVGGVNNTNNSSSSNGSGVTPAKQQQMTAVVSQHNVSQILTLPCRGSHIWSARRDERRWDVAF